MIFILQITFHIPSRVHSQFLLYLLISYFSLVDSSFILYFLMSFILFFLTSFFHFFYNFLIVRYFFFNPRMLFYLLPCVSFGRIILKHILDEVFEFISRLISRLSNIVAIFFFFQNMIDLPHFLPFSFFNEFEKTIRFFCFLKRRNAHYHIK